VARRKVLRSEYISDEPVAAGGASRTCCANQFRWWHSAHPLVEIPTIDCATITASGAALIDIDHHLCDIG
jgi:hypothetical protein